MKKTFLSLLTIIAVIPFFVFLFINSDLDATTSKTSTDESPNQEIESVSAENSNTSNELTHQQIVSITEKFMNKLVQETDDKYKVLNYDNKKDYLNSFSSITTEEVASKYVDFYYEEREDGLYIIPTETPPWFEKGSDYKVEELNGNKVKITQTNQSDLYGTYTIELEFTYGDGWKLTNTEHS